LDAIDSGQMDIYSKHTQMVMERFLDFVCCFPMPLSLQILVKTCYFCTFFFNA